MLEIEQCSCYCTAENGIAIMRGMNHHKRHPSNAYIFHIPCLNMAYHQSSEKNQESPNIIKWRVSWLKQKSRIVKIPVMPWAMSTCSKLWGQKSALVWRRSACGYYCVLILTTVSPHLPQTTRPLSVSRFGWKNVAVCWPIVKWDQENILDFKADIFTRAPELWSDLYAAEYCLVPLTMSHHSGQPGDSRPCALWQPVRS